MYINCYPSDELYHHGIKGQKWGVRRFQNADGTLTSEGRSRYSGSGNSSSGGGVRGAASRATGAVKNKWNGLSDKQKKIIKGAAITAAVALAAYGGYRLSKNETFRAGAAKVGGALKKAGGTAVGKIGTKTQQLKNTASRVYGNTIGAGIENVRGFAAGAKAGFRGAEPNSRIGTDRGAIGAGIRAGQSAKIASINAKSNIQRAKDSVKNTARNIANSEAVGKMGTRFQQAKNKASLAYGNTVGAGIENTRGFASGVKAGLRGRQANSTTDRGAIGAGIRLGNRTRNAANNARESVSNSRVANRARDAYYDMRDDANRRRAERALNKQLRSYSKNGK